MHTVNQIHLKLFRPSISTPLVPCGRVVGIFAECVLIITELTIADQRLLSQLPGRVSRVDRLAQGVDERIVVALDRSVLIRARAGSFRGRHSYRHGPEAR